MEERVTGGREQGRIHAGTEWKSPKLSDEGVLSKKGEEGSKKKEVKNSPGGGGSKK